MSRRQEKYTRKELAHKLDVSLSTVNRAYKNPTKYSVLWEHIIALQERDIITKEIGIIKVTDKGRTVEATVITNTNPAKMSEKEIREAFDVSDDLELQGLTAKVFNQSSKDKNGKLQVIKNYSTSARFRRTTGWNPSIDEMKELYLEWIKEEVPTHNHTKYDRNVARSNNVLVLPIFDAHIGKMAWAPETGENYDIKIASRRYLHTIFELVERANHIGISQIIFPVGQDFYHYTTHDQKTAKGTQQDSDLRWKKMYRDGKNLIRDAILHLEKVAPVTLLFSPGNHDELFSFFLMENLGDYFENHPNVSWNGDIKARQYMKIGVNLIGFSHGNEEGNRLFELMQQEAREMWGETIYAEWIVGHLHHEKVEEKIGVVKRTVRSISGTDEWHYKKGFIGTLKAGQGIIYNKIKPGPYYILTEPIMKEVE